MDETMVSLHTPETKKQPKDGSIGDVSTVHAKRSKFMVMAFFDAAGIIYSHIVLRVKSVNAAYIVKVLKVFVKTMRQKRPQLVNLGLCFPLG